MHPDIRTVKRGQESHALNPMPSQAHNVSVLHALFPRELTSMSSVRQFLHTTLPIVYPRNSSHATARMPRTSARRHSLDPVGDLTNGTLLRNPL
eukprot:5655275-Amphidinium_carterae.1